ncbi:tetratricopeptide repeat protein [Candidatus Laterigemmans baculatus]|uniref:tetratricopeptide repeat protein n=1 Tax=Candidatus Laterigemmans baculatus TaxID=2770505 RepID=UPI0013DCFF26|nr:protein-disulfide isomerase [Candidatus Laterigemmans baculatus]
MAVDQYALCPCGSGKKIKFCKCYDSIGELDKVLKMVGGGQMVAALDRLNQVLAEHPSAAWPLAIKGRLLINLNELDALEENADRFIRLQPSNPLALAQKAASQVFKGRYSEAAHSLLEALAESGRSVDAFLLEIGSVLSMALAQEGQVLSSRLYATLALTTQEPEHSSMAQSVLGELNQSRGLNLLTKSLPLPIDRPEDVSWGERYDEANSLLRSNQILAAEAKFEALDRQFPEQPAILSGLLSCALWRADVEGQTRLLRKLSDALVDEPELSARMRAVSILVEPGQPQLSVAADELVYEIAEADTAVMTLTSQRTAQAIPAEMLRGLVDEQEEVPPRAGFQILDRELPEGDEEAVDAESLPRVLATVLIFGRQTDRSARLEVRDAIQDDHAQMIAQLGDLVSGEPVERRSQSLPLVVMANPRLPISLLQKNRDAMLKLRDQVFRKHFVSAILAARVPASGGEPIASLADDPSAQTVRTAIVRILQGYDGLQLEAADLLAEVATRLKATELPTIVPQNDDELEQLNAFDLASIDPSQLDQEALFYLLQRASQVSSTLASRRAAERLITMEATDEESKAMLSRAYQVLVQAAPTPEAALEMSAKAKAWAESANVSDAPFLLIELQRHLELGDARGFENTIQTIYAKHQNDTNVMMYLQQMLVELGLLNPDGTPRQGPPRQGPPRGSAGGALRGAQPAAAPESPLAAEPSSGSKLWLPGMD